MAGAEAIPNGNLVYLYKPRARYVFDGNQVLEWVMVIQYQLVMALSSAILHAGDW